MNRTELSDKDMEGYLEARSFARKLCKEIINNIKVGMSEKEIEDVVSEIFRNNEVKEHWHMPIIGVGEGSARLRSIYELARDYFTKYTRRLSENDTVLIDIAPIYNGYPSDYTENYIAGDNPDLESLVAYARDVSHKTAAYVSKGMAAADVFRYADGLIRATRYNPAYPPFIGDGHRLCIIPQPWKNLPEAGLTYLLLKARSPFITPGNQAPMSGLWVIEPYMIYKERGAKFETLVFVGEETLILERS